MRGREGNGRERKGRRVILFHFTVFLCFCVPSLPRGVGVTVEVQFVLISRASFRRQDLMNRDIVQR